MAISVNTTNPILQTLQDLNNGGQGAANAGAAVSSTSSQASSAVAIGQNGTLDLSTVDAVGFSLNRATSIADLAIGAGQSVASLLSTLKSQAAAAQDPSIDPTTRQTLNDNFKSVLNQISATVEGASFDGVNLLDGGPSAGLKMPASADGGGILTLSAQPLTLGGPILTLPATASLGTASAAASALADLDDSLSNLQTALSALSDQAGQIAAHGAIINRLSGALQARAAANPSDGADGARLLALQVQQQLGAQTQAIANQSPQLILSLFR